MPIALYTWCYIVLHHSMYANHSLEWNNSTITRVFPSTLRNALEVVTKHNDTCTGTGTKKSSTYGAYILLLFSM